MYTHGSQNSYSPVIGNNRDQARESKGFSYADGQSQGRFIGNSPSTKEQQGAMNIMNQNKAGNFVNSTNSYQKYKNAGVLVFMYQKFDANNFETDKKNYKSKQCCLTCIKCFDPSVRCCPIDQIFPISNKCCFHGKTERFKHMEGRTFKISIQY